MQYMLIYRETEDGFSARTDPERSGPYWGAWTAYMGAMREAGAIDNGAALQPPHSATTVRVSDGKRMVQDGPFADAKEQLGGFVIIEAADLDAALAWAAQAPCAETGSVEVRPVLPMSGSA